MRRQVFEDPAFTAQLNHLGNIKRFDERLRAITWALWLDAEQYPLIAAGETLRVGFLRGTGDEPPLSVWYDIEGDEVILRWIEATPDAPTL